MPRKFLTQDQTGLNSRKDKRKKKKEAAASSRYNKVQKRPQRFKRQISAQTIAIYKIKKKSSEKLDV